LSLSWTIRSRLIEYSDPSDPSKDRSVSVHEEVTIAIDADPWRLRKGARFGWSRTDPAPKEGLWAVVLREPRQVGGVIYIECDFGGLVEMVEWRPLFCDDDVGQGLYG